jgi:hypothetical protein
VEDVDMSTPGTYLVKYDCKNSNGLKANTKTRKIVISEKYQEDYYDLRATIWLGHFVNHTKGDMEKCLAIIAEALNIKNIANVKIKKILTGSARHAHNIALRIEVRMSQKMLAKEVENRLNDEQFEPRLFDLMKEKGMPIDNSINGIRGAYAEGRGGGIRVSSVTFALVYTKLFIVGGAVVLLVGTAGFVLAVQRLGQLGN